MFQLFSSYTDNAYDNLDLGPGRTVISVAEENRRRDGTLASYYSYYMTTTWLSVHQDGSRLKPLYLQVRQFLDVFSVTLCVGTGSIRQFFVILLVGICARTKFDEHAEKEKKSKAGQVGPFSKKIPVLGNWKPSKSAEKSQQL